MGYVLELEVLQAAAVRQYLDRVVGMSRIEVALLEAVLYCQQLEFRRVSSDLGILEACGAYLYNAGFPFTVLLEQDKSHAND